MLQTYQMKRIKRSQIKLADYNPRTIDEDARKRLKKGMKSFGLVQPLIWNRRTGVLVSGHQRLSVLDEMQKYPKKDYELEVAAVDLDEKREMELNVQLNNTSMMGDFDVFKLGEMKELGADIENMGFSESDLDLLFSDEAGLDAITEDSEEAEEAKGTLSDIKADRKKMNAKKETENSASYYFIVVCESEAQRTELYKHMAVPLSEEFVSVNHLRRLTQALANS